MHIVSRGPVILRAQDLSHLIRSLPRLSMQHLDSCEHILHPECVHGRQPDGIWCGPAGATAQLEQASQPAQV